MTDFQNLSYLLLQISKICHIFFFRFLKSVIAACKSIYTFFMKQFSIRIEKIDGFLRKLIANFNEIKNIWKKKVILDSSHGKP